MCARMQPLASVFTAALRAAPLALQIESDDNGGVVARALVLARQLVDDAGADARLQRVADQDVVDAQPLVLAERQVAVVPPAPALGRLLEQAEGVVQAQADEL